MRSGTIAIAVVGVDLSENVFHLHAVDQRGAVIFRCARKRREWVDALRERVDPGAVIAMEACGSSHHWGRLLQSHGYEARLVPGQFVEPFVKSNKNDRVDAEAITEAAMRLGMRFVAVKSQRQQDLQALHRVRNDIDQRFSISAFLAST